MATDKTVEAPLVARYAPSGEEYDCVSGFCAAVVCWLTSEVEADLVDVANFDPDIKSRAI